MRRVLLLAMMSVLFTSAAFSQVENYWSPNSQNRASIATDKAVLRLTYPKEFRLFNLNAAPLRQQLFSIVDKQSKQSTVITLPNAAGNLEQFEIFEASNFEPELQAKFPEIRSFSGRGITDRYATLKLSISPQGIQTMVFRTENANEFIEPYSQDHNVYSVYNSHRDKGQLPWTCSTDDKQLVAGLNPSANYIGALTGSSTGKLKTLRLALSCNGEYSNWFGATSSSQVGLVLAAFNATLNRCNGVFEKDLALHLNLITQTTDVIYYDPTTDPYSPRISNWNRQLQTTLTNVIGEANYDIGHMFGAAGGGGNAGCIGCVCVDGSKGSGITSPADGIPEGDNFDIDYVAHEMGHQLGANHTFSMSNEGTGVNKEVGSGITIMGYAGITSYDVAPHSIDIFHQASIAQIQANMENKTCPVSINMTANHAPVLASVSNYTIPISTPFALTASATDAENDPLTYCWEQNDNSTTTGSGSVASPTKTTGPNWISFLPTSSGTRLFPRLSTILAGLNVTPTLGGDPVANTEALSSVARTLNFRVTVRDNHPYNVGSTIGQTAFTDVVVTVVNTGGPFAVTFPNSNVTWASGSSQTVTWSVNGTDGGSINCANVNILISTDGGNTFTMLVANTHNDGSELITVPNTPGNKNRIKVEAVGNIFFDISNTNFTIGAPITCGNPTGLNASSITASSATLNWTSVSGAVNYDVQYKDASSNTWLNAATGTSSLSVNISGLNASTLYDYRVRANCSGSSGNYVVAQFTTLSGGGGGGACPGTYDTEPNNNTGSAQTIPLNTDIYGTIGASGDNDYYSFSTTGGSVTITLTQLPANYQLALLNNNGVLLQSSTNKGTNNESITRNLNPGNYFVRIYPSNKGQWNATFCYTLNVGGGTASRGGDWITYNKVSLFPNPAKNILNISFDDMQTSKTLKLYDVMGKMVMQQLATKAVTQMNIANLPAGVYVLNIQDGATVQSLKFIKN